MNEDKAYSPEVTRRFLEAMKQIISTSQDFTTKKEFAESVGYYPSAITDLQDGSRNVTLEAVVRLCLVHDVSPEWLLIGTGKMIGGESKEKLLEARLQAIENIVLKRDKSGTKRAKKPASGEN